MYEEILDILCVRQKRRRIWDKNNVYGQQTIRLQYKTSERLLLNVFRN